MATREAVAKKYIAQYPGIRVAYLKVNRVAEMNIHRQWSPTGISAGVTQRKGGAVGDHSAVTRPTVEVVLQEHVVNYEQGTITGTAANDSNRRALLQERKGGQEQQGPSCC